MYINNYCLFSEFLNIAHIHIHNIGITFIVYHTINKILSIQTY